MERRTEASELLARRVEINTSDIRREHLEGHDGPCRDGCPIVAAGPGLPSPPARRGELVDEEESAHGEEEDVTRDIVAAAQAGTGLPFCLRHEQRGGEEARVRGGRNRGGCVAVLARDGEHIARGKSDDALPTSEANNALEQRGSKEPASEDGPDARRRGVLVEAFLRARGGRGCEKEESEGGGGPEPEAFDEEGIERVCLRGEEMGVV